MHLVRTAKNSKTWKEKKHAEKLKTLTHMRGRLNGIVVKRCIDD
jgi:hypothetical protein